MENWLLIGVGLIFLICIIVGYVRGAIRIVASLAATVITLIAVIVATPYVSKALYKVTPIPEMIQEKCSSVMLKAAKEQLGSQLAQKVAEAKGLDLSNLDESAFGSIDWKELGVEDEDLLKALSGIEVPRELQVQVIENSELPAFLQTKITENNNSAVYSELGVSGFADYIGAYIAKLVTDIIAFLGTFLIVTLVVRIALYAANIIGELPLIHGFNRLAGGALGMATGLIIVWTLFIVITLLYSTDTGKNCFAMIEKSQLLTFLYDHNLIMKWVLPFHS